MTTTEPQEIERADEVVDAVSTSTAVTALTPLERLHDGIVALHEAAAAVDLTPAALATVAGDKAVRAIRAKCVALRTRVDEAYETVNRPLLDTQKRARRLAAEIKEAIAAVEDPADAAIKADEARRDRERKARAAAEEQRRAALRARIDSIAGLARRAVGKGSADITEKIRIATAQEIGDDFADMKSDAQRVHAETLAALRELLAAAQAHEAEQATLAAERARLERVELFHRKLQELRGAPIGLRGLTAAAMQQAIDGVDQIELGDDWEEFRGQAVEAKDAVLAEMRAMLAEAVERDRVAAEQAAERVRLAEQRAEQERADAAARAARELADRQAAEARAEADRKAAAERETERCRQEAAQRVERERQQAEQQRLDNARAELERDRAATEAANLAAARARAANDAAARGASDIQIGRVLERFSHDGQVLSADTEDFVAAMNALQPESVAVVAAEVPPPAAASDREHAVLASGPDEETERALSEARKALTEALGLLRGWIDTKGLKKHRAEHLNRIADLRRRGGLPEETAA
jgi:hypothetical protein